MQNNMNYIIIAWLIYWFFHIFLKLSTPFSTPLITTFFISIFWVISTSIILVFKWEFISIFTTHKMWIIYGLLAWFCIFLLDILLVKWYETSNVNIGSVIYIWIFAISSLILWHFVLQEKINLVQWAGVVMTILWVFITFYFSK